MAWKAQANAPDGVTTTELTVEGVFGFFFEAAVMAASTGLFRNMPERTYVRFLVVFLSAGGADDAAVAAGRTGAVAGGAAGSRGGFRRTERRGGPSLSL